MTDQAAGANAGHRGRLKDKYLAYGLDSLTDEEVVELLLTLGQPRRNCKPAARAAMKKFGSLRGVLAADPDDLARIDGLGRRNTVALRLIQDAAGRFLRDKLLGRDFLTSPREVFDYFYHRLRDQAVESIGLVFLDAKNGVIGLDQGREAAVSGGGLSPQAAVRRALAEKAAGLVLVHNHPSGQTEPSAADRRLTRALLFAAQAVEINLVDHLIIGDNRYFSFSEAGLISRYRGEWETMAGLGG